MVLFNYREFAFNRIQLAFEVVCFIEQSRLETVMANVDDRL